MRFKSDSQRRAVMATIHRGKMNYWQLRILRDEGLISRNTFSTFAQKPSRIEAISRSKKVHKPLKRFMKSVEPSKFFPTEKEVNIEEKADITFRRSHQLNRADKVQDLMETAPVVLPLTQAGFKEWKKDIKGKDIQNVDTLNFQKAEEYTTQTEYTKADLQKAENYLREHPEIRAKTSRYFELRRDLAKEIAKGTEPDLIDLNALVTEDKGLTETIAEERDLE